MGGIGSGRRNQSGNCTTDEYRRLDVRRWQRDGFLAPGRTFGWEWTRNGETTASIQVRIDQGQAILSYRRRSSGGDWRHENYPVQLDWTPCTYGGQRAWFLCPANGCGKRVAVLYGGGIFACRRCHRLAYPSQRETADDRAARRANTIRRRLGWPVGILNPRGGKPKGMRWRTFERLTAEHDAFVSSSLAGMSQRFRNMMERLK